MFVFLYSFFSLFLQTNSVPGPCPTSDDLKYTMTRLAMDGADLYVVEHGCATNIKVKIVFWTAIKYFVNREIFYQKAQIYLH